MFSSFSRSLMRRAPAMALAGGASLATAQSCSQPAACDMIQKRDFPVTRKSFSQSVSGDVRHNKGDFPIAIGHQFLQMYFAEFADKAGKISLHSDLSFDEATVMLQAAGAKEEQCKEILALMDTDGSGSIDFCEIMVFFLNHGKGSLQEKGSLFFHACDIDGSGSVEATELKDIIHHMMLLKNDEEGTSTVTAGEKRLYHGIPGTYVIHLQANALVNDIFVGAGKVGTESVTEKQFQTWLTRGGKQVNRLLALFDV